MVNRSLLVVAVALCASLAGGALYGRLAEGEVKAAAPAHAAAASDPSTFRTPALLSAPAPSSLPHSREQARLEQRRWLYETVDSLLQASELERARKLLDEGLARYGEEAAPEWRDLDVGYRLIADCLERPHDPKPRVRARAFIGVTDARILVPKLQTACK